MGSVRKYLYQSKLPDREMHHSRLFIDLAENIHIHHREYRTVFSLDEFFEYTDIIKSAENDVRNFLEQNPSYEEMKYPTTILIAGGKNRQLKFLKNSPAPNNSYYYNNDFAIELQDEFVTDEIHIHYRDFRIALDRQRFKEVAQGFSESLLQLEKFEMNNVYRRDHHPDRLINDFNEGELPVDSNIQGVKKISISDIKSRHYKDILSEFKPQFESIVLLKKFYSENGYFIPVILNTRPGVEGENYFIVDGHHRIFTALQLGLSSIDAIIIDVDKKAEEMLGRAEHLLKEFDIETNYRYGISEFYKSFIGFRLNRYYAGAFKRKMVRQTRVWRFLRWIKLKVFGKKKIFQKFNESHNHHN